MVDLMVLILGDGVSEKCPVDGILIVSGILCAAHHDLDIVSNTVYMEIGEGDQLMITQLMNMNQM